MRLFFLLAVSCFPVLTSAMSLPDDSDLFLRINQRIADASSSDRHKALLAADELVSVLQEFRSARPEFERLINSNDPLQQLVGVKMLWALDGKRSSRHLSILTSCLACESDQARRTAISLIGKLNEVGSPALPQLTRLLKDKDADIRILAAGALGNIGAAASTASGSLAELLEDEESGSWGAVGVRNTVQLAASDALRRIGAGALPAVEPFLKSQNLEVRIAAMNVLAGGGESAKRFVPFLTTSLEDESARIRRVALELLFVLKPRSVTTIQRMVEMLFDEDETIALYCLGELEKTPEKLETSVDRIVPLLAKESAFWRASVAQLLGNIGSNEGGALVKLRELSKDRAIVGFYEKFDRQTVGSIAAEAIEKIKGRK